MQPVRLGGGDFNIIWKSSLITASLLWERWSMFPNTAVTKQWMTKWSYTANAVFRIVQNDSKQSYFRRFFGGWLPPLYDPPLRHRARHCDWAFIFTRFWCTPPQVQSKSSSDFALRRQLRSWSAKLARILDGDLVQFLSDWLTYAADDNVETRVPNAFEKCLDFMPQTLWSGTARVGLKPMQPMQLQWAPRLWGPSAVVFR